MSLLIIGALLAGAPVATDTVLGRWKTETHNAIVEITRCGVQVYTAEDGKTYSGKITPVGPDQLKLRGCVFFPLCKTQTWTRAR